MKINFSPPYIDNSVIDEVTDSLKSGWITTGPKVKLLEEEVRKYTASKAVLCVNSWTSGTIMILKWWGIQPGDEVIIPAYTYCATALAVIHAGGIPVIVDVGDDFNINLDSIKKAITPKTKAIIPVDFSGYPCDYDEILNYICSPEALSLFMPVNELQQQLGRILLISDAAHSFGALYKGKSNALSADVVIYSFHAVKNITTAEGGAICLNLPKPFDNEKLYTTLRIMTLNCQTKDAFTKSQAGAWSYDIIGLGMKINMPDINAALGLAQLRKYDELLDRRKAIFELYNKAFQNESWAIIPPQKNADKETSYHIYPLRIQGVDELTRNRIIELIAAAEVAVNVHFIPISMLSYFKELGNDINLHPQAYKNYCNEISLPVYPQLTNEEIQYVIDIVSEAVKSVF